MENWLLYHIEFQNHKHDIFLFISASVFPDIPVDSPGGSDSKESACNSGDLGSTSGWGRYPGEGNGYLLQYSCLENPMDWKAWQDTVHRVAESWTRLEHMWDLICSLLFGNIPLMKNSISLIGSMLFTFSTLFITVWMLHFSRTISILPNLWNRLMQNHF